MTRYALALWLILATVSLAWLGVERDIVATTGFIAVRNLLVQYTGLLAMAAMSVSMVLALRPKWLGGPLGGLDKIYRLHKWLGIGALVLSVAHWVSSNAPRWAVASGLMERGQRPPRAPLSDPIEQFLSSYRGIAEIIGEWTFYATVLLIIVALVKAVPYRLFYKTHRLLAVAYLALVAHSIVLTKFSYWLSPLGLLLALLLLAGSYSSVIVLLGRIRAGRKTTARIASLQYYPGVHALEVAVDGADGWTGHEPGQFAFVTSNTAEGAHPYTIASAWNDDDRRIIFIVKELGDHTARLSETLRVGQDVVIEGPYGYFTFEDDCPVQIWVGGGIGITPFVARMKHLAGRDRAATPEIHLFHPTATTDDTAFAKLAADAVAAGVQLHVSVDARDGFLTGERIRSAVPRWAEASLWFCGPTGLGATLRHDFARAPGAVGRRFHQELFEMR